MASIFLPIRTGTSETSEQNTMIIPKKLKTGTITVGTTATSGPNVKCCPGRDATLYAPNTNTASVYVGDADVTPETGLEIEPGGGIVVQVENLNQLYFVSTSPNQTIKYAVETVE